MTTSQNSFSENLAHIAKLDNSFGIQIDLSHNSIVLKADVAYSANCTLSLYNRTTNVTETITVTSSTLTTLTLAAYLTKIETDIEAANASCTVLAGTTSTTSQVATFNNVSISIAVAGIGYYVRELNLTISDSVGIKYSVDGEILNPIELTPKMLDLTPEIILALGNASNNATSAANSLASIQAIQTALSNGRVWFFGATQQSADTGIDGDAGFNTATGDVSRKIDGTWTIVGSLSGGAIGFEQNFLIMGA